MKKRPYATLTALSLLYAAQGVPYGFASEYLPVVLRQSGYSMGAIAAVGWLQLPWQLKVIWAGLADRQAFRSRSRGILLALQTVLFATLVLFALRTLKEAPVLWFVLTAVAALFASTQDIFVDALAVRVLDVSQRGFGNTAQVAGYRLGILAGGAGLLVMIAPLGYRGAVLACASFVLVTSFAAFFLREHAEGDEAAPPLSKREASLPVKAMMAHLVHADVWPVAAVALTYKLGLHMAAVLIKPIVVDARWTEHEIGLAVVTVGITAGLVGAALGGAMHRWIRERRALVIGAFLQALVCVPLVVSLHLGVPRGWTTLAIATEHFVSGLGTTVLFAALMSATRRADAGLHYTLLTSLNSVAIGVGGTVGGA
ncbi:MAG TPA: MFS transporter, partial [Polyangiaceae bacterium]